MFAHDELDDAFVWLAELPRAGDVSHRDIVMAYLGGVGAAAAGLGDLVLSKRGNRRT